MGVYVWRKKQHDISSKKHGTIMAYVQKHTVMVPWLKNMVIPWYFLLLKSSFKKNYTYCRGKNKAQITAQHFF